MTPLLLHLEDMLPLIRGLFGLSAFFALMSLAFSFLFPWARKVWLWHVLGFGGLAFYFVLTHIFLNYWVVP